MVKEPIICPFCAGTLLQELQPSELEIDDAVWTIYHWQCLECEETFEKLVEEDEAYMDEFEDEDAHPPTNN